MNGDLTHASFFSGVGGLDMGLERAGWRTVSFSEIDPYASAVLAQRWPGVPNLGDIVDLARQYAPERKGADAIGRRGGPSPSTGSGVRCRGVGDDADPIGGGAAHGWHRATLWTGGFPCQDLSVAGKRRGMGEGTRSGLAFAFLELVGRHRPRFILLENVPGLLSSHGGRDMARLLGEMVELGYGVGYRTLDARYFGVPQRRRRVFILGDSLGGRVGAERAAEVLSVGSRCRRHPPTGVEAGEGVAQGAPLGSDEFVGPVDGALGHHGVAYPQQSVNMGHIRVSGPIRTGNRLTRQELDDIGSLVSPSPDPRRVREADGLARRVDDRPGVDHARPLLTNSKGGQRTTDLNIPLVAYTKSHNVDGAGNAETWVSGREARSMNSFDGNRTTLVIGESSPDDPLLPLGLDSHRYRCCGNGVVSDVAEWIGLQLAALA